MSIFKNFQEYKDNQEKEKQDRITNSKESLKCKKDLFKRTYNRNAFDSGKEYVVTKKSNDIIFVVDNEGHEFNFSIEKKDPFYWLSDYFEV